MLYKTIQQETIYWPSLITNKYYQQDNKHFEYKSAIDAQTNSLQGRPCPHCELRAFTGMPVTPHA